MYTLDTNAIIYSLNRDLKVVSAFDDLLENPDPVFYVSTVTEIELYSYPELSEAAAGITRLLTDPLFATSM